MNSIGAGLIIFMMTIVWLNILQSIGSTPNVFIIKDCQVTLTGNVLPIGGLKEKILAAHRAGIKKILIPSDNKKDLVEIPKNILENIKIDTVKTVDEVIKIALIKELKPVEWIEVDKIPKSSNEKNVPGSTH